MIARHTLRTLCASAVFAVSAAASAAPDILDNAVSAGSFNTLVTAVLTYHVVPATALAKDVKVGNAPTVNGKALRITATGGNVMVDKARGIKTDVVASNGIIHVIDTVIMP